MATMVHELKVQKAFKEPMPTKMHELRAPKAFEELMATKLHELKAQQAFRAGAVRQGFGIGGLHDLLRVGGSGSLRGGFVWWG